MKENIKAIQAYSAQNYEQMIRRPEGQLPYPFIVPGSASYNDCLWDWDSWLTDVAVRQIMLDNGKESPDFESAEKGCILNFLAHTGKNGRMPIMLKANSMFPKEGSNVNTNIHKPCLTQHAAFIIGQNKGDGEWLRPYLKKLQSFIHYYMEHMRHPATGLYFWLDDLAIGVDNDPCTFYRPRESSASVYLNCLIYRELLAMVYIEERLGESGEEYLKEAQHLKAAVNEHLWDERNGFYYSADLNLRPIDPDDWLHRGMPRHWDCVLQKIDCWSGALVLWAGITDSERASRMVEENLTQERLFNGKYGVRTLAKTEPMYRVVASNNPSCWLGPVWGVSNYLCFRGLVQYGFDKEAADLAGKTIRLFGEDLRRSDQMHEYYDPDTGEGVMNPGFQNWNLLANNMIAWLEGREVMREF
ncbi:MAG: hypothetical protein LUE87_04315 [Lachnospiraceae bacterium]|nr:hypothetical protein [Lachnospiraceae bacterium]